MLQTLFAAVCQTGASKLPRDGHVSQHEYLNPLGVPLGLKGMQRLADTSATLPERPNIQGFLCGTDRDLNRCQVPIATEQRVKGCRQASKLLH